MKAQSLKLQTGKRHEFWHRKQHATKHKTPENTGKNSVFPMLSGVLTAEGTGLEHWPKTPGKPGVAEDAARNPARLAEDAEFAELLARWHLLDAEARTELIELLRRRTAAFAGDAHP